MITDIARNDGVPKPNAHDLLDGNSLTAKGTNAINYITPATNKSILQKGKNGQLTVVQTGQFSTQPFRVSSPNTSTWVSGSFQHVQIPHNLGYVPAVYGYFIGQGGSGEFRDEVPQFYHQVGNDDGTLNPSINSEFSSWYFKIDATFLYLYTDYLLLNFIINHLGGDTVRYYLLQQVSN